MNKPLVLAAAQLNLWVGDLDGNVAKIVAAATRARDEFGAQLLATPELSLLGYPPDDLLLRTALPQAIEAALAKIAAASSGIHIVVGHPDYAGGSVYNAASVYRDGQLVIRARKQLLPNYGVFDEKRHFEPGAAGAAVFTLDGLRIGLCICEDIWGSGPAAAAKAAGAQALLNVNASPYNIGKPAERLAVLRQRVAEVGLPIIYVNCTGGQDELVFDGDSMAISASGDIGFRAPLFEEGVYPIRFEALMPRGAIRAPTSTEAEVYAGLVQATRDYVTRNGFPGVLLGLSGGIDSALIAAIAADALGPDKVWAVSLPSRYTLDMSNDDARIEAERLGIRHSVLPIEKPFTAFGETLAPLFGDRPIDLTEENMQSRSRGVLLMALSNKFGSVVLTTGNKSEMATGYCTLYGDMAGGFAVIKDLAKTLVYRLSRWRNAQAAAAGQVEPIPERIITRPPSAELRPDQTDQDSLPEYDVLDAILERYMEQDQSIEQIVAAGFAPADVDKVTRLIKVNEYKRRQAPIGIRITHRAFGRDWRYPITSRFRA